MIFKAKDFKTRSELEKKIQAEVGTNIVANREAGHTIEGTKEELKKLHLSETTTVFGVKCKING